MNTLWIGQSPIICRLRGETGDEAIGKVWPERGANIGGLVVANAPPPYSFGNHPEYRHKGPHKTKDAIHLIVISSTASKFHIVQIKDDDVLSFRPQKQQERSKTSGRIAMIRDLTDAEIEAFRDQGWVHVKGLIAPEVAGQLLDRSRAIMGDEALVSTGAGGGAEDPSFAEYRDILRNYLGMWKVEPLMEQVSHSRDLARNVSRLLHGHPVRFFNDEVLVKPPMERGGKSTPWHQDFPHGAFDRTGLVNVWISLVDLPADGGAMSFLTGSHRHGPLGRTLLDKQDVVAQNPWLVEQCPPSPVPAMKAGDATIHGDLTIHGRPAFKGSHWRWAYLVNLMDATVRYSGGPSYGERVEGIEPNEPYPDDRYPVIYHPEVA